jgi:hypothetical protein
VLPAISALSIAAALRGRVIGDGTVYLAIREVQCRVLSELGRSQREIRTDD